MGKALGSSRVHRFGVFEFDPSAGELRKHGMKLKLQGQPIEILALLLECPGEVVTREELQKKLWPADTFVDFEHSLNAAVKRLRDALDDSAETPRYIETLARRGYRFIAPVDGAAPISVRPPMSASFSSAKMMALGVLVIILAVTAVFAVNSRKMRERLPPSTSEAHIESLAVLPFENLSGDPQQEYFADGMTEELVTSLGKISPLRVISRTSVMRYKGSKKPLPEIARELSVDAIVEGTVQRSGSHVRITANLLYAPTDRHLWADSYESELGDVLVLQGKVARSIASEIGIKLTPQVQVRVPGTPPLNPEAYQAYLKGRYYTSQWTEDGFKKAAASFRQAIDLDPTYARAYGGLAEVYSWRALSGLQPSSETYPLAKAAALKALELDEGLAEAHAALGLTKLEFDWDWPGAERELKRAVMLNPNASSTHLWYGLFLTVMGRPDEAVKETRNALDLDPLTPTTNLQLGWVLYYARRHDESIAQLKKTLELAPDVVYANMELAWNYAQKRMYPESIIECQKAVSLAPEEQVTLGSCGGVYALAGKRQDAIALLDRLKKLSTQGYVDPYNFAGLHDSLGDNNLAMQWLERAYRERSASLAGVKIEIWSNALRSDSRFQNLLRRMNFPSQP